MADSTTELATLHPAFTTKALLIEAVRAQCGPNSPNIAALLLRLVHTDMNGTGSMTGGATVTPSSYKL